MLLEKCSGCLDLLSLNQTQLSSLKGLPEMKELVSLELQDNRLSGPECIETITKCCPKIELLLLAGNKFKNLEDFVALAKLPHLDELDIFMNPVTSDDPAEERSRTYLFQLLPNVRIVNGRDRSGKEVVLTGESEDDEEDEEEEENENADEPSADPQSAASQREENAEDDCDMV